MEGRRISTQLIVVACVAGCGEEAPQTPRRVDAWARALLARTPQDVCTPGTPATAPFCFVRIELLPADIRALGMRSVTLQLPPTGDRFIDLDWGGGHVAAYGAIIGPASWSHKADLERSERELRDGVFSYDLR